MKRIILIIMMGASTATYASQPASEPIPPFEAGTLAYASTPASEQTPPLSECPICYNMRDLTTSNFGNLFFGCPHNFCTDCAQRMIERKINNLHTFICPFCRAHPKIRALCTFFGIPYESPAPIELRYINSEFISWEYVLSDIARHNCGDDQPCSVTVASTAIGKIPDALFEPAHGIVQLNITANAQLRKLPATIANATVLRSLNLSNNMLTQLTEEICHLPALEELNLSRSLMLEELPACLKNMHALKLLAIANSRYLDPIQAWESAPDELVSFIADTTQIKKIRDHYPDLSPARASKLKSTYNR